MGLRERKSPHNQAPDWVDDSIGARLSKCVMFLHLYDGLTVDEVGMIKERLEPFIWSGQHAKDDPQTNPANSWEQRRKEMDTNAMYLQERLERLERAKEGFELRTHALHDTLEMLIDMLKEKGKLSENEVAELMDEIDSILWEG